VPDINSDGSSELLLTAEDWTSWTQTANPGLKMRELWQREGGLSIALLHFSAGASMATRHRHASNQFMYCLSGRYAYPSSDIVLAPGDFYWNPKGNHHGPTEALEPTTLIEIYDGPHYVDVSEAPVL
jgi:mannose-6-phosphate isomerase-like protein (cupin superfamily)